jgi:serine/threonine protein kinase
MTVNTNVMLLDRYRLKTEIGRGGMGTVYRGYDIVLERDVAVKVLSGTNLGTDGRARMLREAKAVAALNHPNIITVHDTGEADLIGLQGTGAYGAIPFVVMELIEGQNLHEQPPQDLEQTLTIACQLCAALEFDR